MTLRALLAAGLCALALAACSRTGGEERGRLPATHPHELRIGDNLDINSLNPHLDSSTTLASIASMTMAYLLRSDANNGPVPELATVVPTQRNGGISPDGRTITWHLRHDARWSDGVAFTADDVVFSTRAVLNPANNEVGRDGWSLIERIDEPDRYTVVFHLRKPYSAFFPTFFGVGGANPCILPKHILGALANINAAPYNSKPVGIGPFVVDEWVRGDHVTLVPNPRYFRGRPKLQRITYRFIPDRNTLLTQLQTGEIDLWPYVGPGYYDRVRAIPHVAVYRKPDYYYQHIDFNLARPALRDPAVRTALRMAVDRAAIVAKVNHGTGIAQESMETPSSPVYHALPFVAFDIAKANALLDRAGWVRGADGVRAKRGLRLAFTFALQSGNPDYDELVELVRASWQHVGVTLAVKRYDGPLFFAPYQAGGIVYGGKFDLILFAWGLDPIGDLSNIFACDQFPPGGQNDAHYCNRATDALMDRVKATYDLRTRAGFVAQVTAALDRDVPTIVLYIRDGIHASSTDLKGWHPNQIGPFDDMLAVDI